MFKKIDLNLILVAVIAAILRLVNLGYSDFQGDEIKALFTPTNFSEGVTFLLTQRKGPLQFLVTFFTRFFDPAFTNQFLIRLPFAVAGVLAVIYFYKLLALHFNKKIALYAALFMTTNGFFVAFSRIAQYQSFVILFSVLTLYFLSKQKLYYAAISWALALLSHYDGFFIAPVVLAILISSLKQAKVSVKPVIVSFMIFMLLTLAFYIPFVLHVSPDTANYWTGRLTGEASDKISSSYYLFTVYQPIYVIHIYIGLFAICLAVLLLALSPKVISKVLTKIKIFSVIFNKARELLVVEIGLGKFFVVFAWFLIAFIFWEQIVYIPGTHIYTYLIPAFILISIALYYVETILTLLTPKARLRLHNTLNFICISVVFVFLFLQSYFIFVDHFKEYPWQEKQFLIWTLSKPTATYHLSMFGYPYYRDWENISRFVKQHPEISGYSTNERDSISRFYIPLRKDAVFAGYYVFINFPQSFEDKILNEKAVYWANQHSPVYTYSKNGVDLVSIYEMPVGPLEELRLKGY